jgi:hypothetical protein
VRAALVHLSERRLERSRRNMSSEAWRLSGSRTARAANGSDVLALCWRLGWARAALSVGSRPAEAPATADDSCHDSWVRRAALLLLLLLLRVDSRPLLIV